MKKNNGSKLVPLLESGKIIFFDGGMGTMIQARGAEGHSCPEELNLSDPGLIQKIHDLYVKAGSQVITTNTFGANRVKLARVGLQDSLPDIIEAGVRAARSAAGTKALVAGGLGPLGEFVDPLGSVTPGEAFESFKEAAGLLARAGADLLIIETMSDLKEVRAACLGAAHSGLPFIVTMNFDESGRTVLGTPPEAAAITTAALGTALTGANCSLGPEKLLPVVQSMAAVARCPLIVQPNAGIPVLHNDRTVFPTGPEEFAEGMEAFLEVGVRAIGGCCGTTPDHIAGLVKRLRGRRPVRIEALSGCYLASRTSHVLIGRHYPVAVIGERINPTGRKKLAGEMKTGNLDGVRTEIINQVKAGADMLDLNAGSAEIDEKNILPRIVELAQKIVHVPLVLDSTNPAALEASLAVLEGRALINSVNASERSLESILPLAARFGTAVIGLTMDENGIPDDAAGRIRLAERIIARASDFGLEPSDILIDCLAVAAGSDQHQVMETLKAVQSLGTSLNTGSILGVSNISYGLPARGELNSSFISMAVYCGLDSAIINPYSTRIMDALAASMVLSGRDPGASIFLKKHAGSPKEGPPGMEVIQTIEEQITESVIQGDGDRLVKLVDEALDSGADPMGINRELLIPALERVGDLFEKKIFFLPQVIASADAVRLAFDVVKKRMPAMDEGHKAKILLATVEGDIHDLGKNILKSLLENYGYLVEDLGINIPAKTVAKRMQKGDINMVGLSALMTTTLPAMEETVRLIKERYPDIPVILGGAVLTKEYAAGIGADGYAPDASSGVKLARELLSSRQP